MLCRRFANNGLNKAEKGSFMTAHPPYQGIIAEAIQFLCGGGQHTHSKIFLAQT